MNTPSDIDNAVSKYIKPMNDMESQPLLMEPARNAEEASATSSSMAIHAPKPEKRTTRQWAAWTRQEEESFFNALRQVGKNFEKITCRVQSKNKDQVRHYYYRLVRRMNKLLGPGFSLDAKNSKDTVAAMLRWWSLLEKYSCTASKLHLKPRRFKIFLEALESQLLKDRSKTRRKIFPNEIYLAATPTAIKGTGDSHQVKVIAVDAPSTNKVAATRVDSCKHEMCSNINLRRRDSSNMKALRRKRRSGFVSSAAYKRWEKAAIAGVSLVADAAEQLEQATKSGNCSFSYRNYPELPNEAPNSKGLCSHDRTTGCTMKLKLELFPIDKCTRRALEKDAHNPHLELTLSARKMISSVIEHLNCKWGNSSIAVGELMLFPCSVQLNDLASCQKWTINDTCVSTADVYTFVGSPSIFRLRYGWLSGTKPWSEVQESSECQSFDKLMELKDTWSISTMIGGHGVEENSCGDAEPTTHNEGKPLECPEDESLSLIALATSVVSTPDCVTEAVLMDCKDAYAETSQDPALAWISTKSVKEANQRNVVGLETSKQMLSATEWADKLTNISNGDLFTEASKVAESNCASKAAELSSLYHHQMAPVSSDSFDAAIAAHKPDKESPMLNFDTSHVSIFAAEETCDEFSFRMIPAGKENLRMSASTSIACCRESVYTTSLGFQNYLKELALDQPKIATIRNEGDTVGAHKDRGDMVEADKDPTCKDESDHGKDTCLTDVYWPDSLGPLDLDIPSKFQYQDLIFGENLSLSAFSRLTSNSLDVPPSSLFSFN